MTTDGAKDGASSSSIIDASRSVAQGMTRAWIRSVFAAIVEQDADWLAPLVEIWGRHMAWGEGAIVVSWLREEMAAWGTPELENAVPVDLPRHPINVDTAIPKQPITIWAKLRRLGQSKDHDILSPTIDNDASSYEDQLQQAIHQLDEYGRTNQTYWFPDQWPVIERATEQMRARLHAKETTSSASWDTRMAQVLFSNGDDAPPPPNDEETMRRLVDRKRKSVNKKRRWNAAEQKFVPYKKAQRPVLEEEEEADPPLDEVPRPASQDPGSALLDWKRAMEQAAFQYEPHLHDTASATTDSSIEPTTSRLLGALRDLGHFHGHAQAIADGATTVRRGEARRARLGNHRSEETKEKKKRPWSKIWRTLSPPPPHNEHWFDLDVGHCILEDRGSLYAFRSLEMCLRDEDT